MADFSNIFTKILRRDTLGARKEMAREGAHATQEALGLRGGSAKKDDGLTLGDVAAVAAAATGVGVLAAPLIKKAVDGATDGQTITMDGLKDGAAGLANDARGAATRAAKGAGAMGLYTADQINGMTARGKAAEGPVPGQPPLPVSKEAEAALKLFGRKTPTVEGLAELVAKGKISDNAATELINANRVKLPDPKTIQHQDPSKVPVVDRSTYSPEAAKEKFAREFVGPPAPEPESGWSRFKNWLSGGATAVKEGAQNAAQAATGAVAAGATAVAVAVTPAPAAEQPPAQPTTTSPVREPAKVDAVVAGKPVTVDAPASTTGAPVVAGNTSAPAAPPEKADAKSDIERKAISVDFSLSTRFKEAADYLNDPSKMNKALGKDYYENALDTMVQMAGVKDRGELKTLLEVQEKQKVAAAPTAPAPAP